MSNLGDASVQSGAPYSDLTDEEILPLRYMVNLVELRLCDNQPLTDLTPLSNLVNLRELSLWLTPIPDIAPLAGLRNLTTLNLNGVGATDLTPLAGLTNLTSLIYAGGPQDGSVAIDLTPLAGLVNLTSLSVTGRGITDLTPLVGLVNLNHFQLTQSNVADLSPLAGLSNLETVRLMTNDYLPEIGRNIMFGGTNQVSNIEEFQHLFNGDTTADTQQSTEIIDTTPRPITVTINGTRIEFEQPPIAIGGVPLTAVRPIAEYLQFASDWDAATQTLTFSKDGLTVSAQLNSNTLVVNGVNTTMHSYPRIINGFAFIPVIPIAENFGATVEWDYK